MDREMTEPRTTGVREKEMELPREKRITLRRLEMEAAAVLAQAGIEEAQLDAHRLLLEAFGLDETHYLLERTRVIADDTEVDAADAAAGMSRTAGNACAAEEKPAAHAAVERTDELARYRGMISRRAARIPLQQILGRQEFMGLTFQVNENVLIPRQDTETLAELVLAEQKDPAKRILDLCTGSGCIAISLAAKGSYADVTAADLSAEALSAAEQNARELLRGGGWQIFFYEQEQEKTSDSEQPAETIGCTTDSKVKPEEDKDRRYFRLCQGNLFAALPRGSRYDIIVSNPPYIPSAVIGGLQPEVRDHEPRMALDGAEDGLAFYRRIAAQAPGWLNPGGAVYLEIGCDQAEAVSGLLADAGFVNIEVFKDLPGLDRVVRAFWL